jgi:hypothetical protein
MEEFDYTPKLDSPDEQEVLNYYLDYFHLRNEKEKTMIDNTTPSVEERPIPLHYDDLTNLASNSTYETLMKCFRDEENTLDLFDKDVKKLKKKLDSLETFINQFLDTSCPVETIDTNKSTNMSSKQRVLNLMVDGELIQCKYSTICRYENSYFAKCFSNIEWKNENTVKINDNESAILVELPSSLFKVILNQLRMIAMFIPDDNISVPSLLNTKPCIPKEEMNFFNQFISSLFPGNDHYLLLGSRMLDSNILHSSKHHHQIKTWLFEEIKQPQSEPMLLYRASRDGWKANDFHCKCDEKGDTLTIIKTSEGFIFGGYSDNSWRSGSFKSSTRAFLFSIQSYAKLPPTKLNLKSGCQYNAIYANFSHGPCFGSGIDLAIGSNGDLKSGFTNLARTYELPFGAWNTFLTGKHGSCNKFDIAEVETFRI